MISYSVDGSTAQTEAFLKRMTQGDLYSGLEPLARQGVDALRAATPRDSGLTADSWTFEIEHTGTAFTIWWMNTNTNGGFNVAVGLQYGHATGTGGWIQGYDYINPSLKPIFDQIAETVWKEVQKA